MGYAREILGVVKPVSGVGPSKILENNLCLFFASAYFLLKDLFWFFFGDQVYESDYFDHFCHKNHTFSDLSLIMLFLNSKTIFLVINFIKSNFAHALSLFFRITL